MLFKFFESFLTVSHIDTTSADFKSSGKRDSEMQLFIFLWSSSEKIAKILKTDVVTLFL